MKFQNKIDITANKGNLGHCFSSAGLIETIIGLESLKSKEIPPIYNYMDNDFNLPNLNFVKNAKTNKNLNYLIKNSFGFGGVNNSIFITK